MPMAEERVRSESPEEPRKRTRVRNCSPLPCYDWMIVSGTCHYARDRSAFKTYRPVRASDELNVEGVGTVELEVCPSPRQFGSRTIVLENVLHLPNSPCNGFNPMLTGGSMSCGRDLWHGTDANDRPLWYGLPFAGLNRLVLAGNPQGESLLVEGQAYSLSIYIGCQEMERLLSGDEMMT